MRSTMNLEKNLRKIWKNLNVVQTGSNLRQNNPPCKNETEARKRRITLTSIRPQGSIVFAYRMVNRPRRQEGNFYAEKRRRRRRKKKRRPPSFARGFSRHLRFDISYPGRRNDSSDRRKVDSCLWRE